MVSCFRAVAVAMQRSGWIRGLFRRQHPLDQTAEPSGQERELAATEHRVAQTIVAGTKPR